MGIENREFGSVTRLNGRTVIVSIFMDDKTTRWDYGDPEEIGRMYDTIDRIRAATDWICQNAARWGAKPEFLFDWSNDQALFARAKYDKNMIWEDFHSENHYYLLCDFIKNHIKSEEIKKKYCTDSLLYMFFYDTEPKSKARSYAFSYEKTNPYPYEMCNIFCRCFGGESGASTYAHEILHTFGAPDLYYESALIPQKYVDYCKKTKSKDIMFTSAVQYPDRVDALFTEVTAYYTGLIKTCPTVTKWGLGKSKYVK